MAAQLSHESRSELDRLRQQLRQQLDSRKVALVPRDDDHLEDLRVYMPRTVEQHESKFDTDEFDPRDWIDGYSAGQPDALYETTNDAAFTQVEFPITKSSFEMDENGWPIRRRVESGRITGWMPARGKRRSYAPAYPTDLEALEKQRALDTLRWLHREESDAEIHYRWIMTPEQRIQSDDSLTESEKAALLDELQAGREQWTARQTQFRRAQLHRLCIEWFRTNDYSSHDVVVSWKREGDRWMPDERMNVVAWIRSKVAERGELAGYASCAATLRNRIARRRTGTRGA